MDSTSRCLIDGSLLLDLMQRGALSEVCRVRRVAVGELALAAVRDGRDTVSVPCLMELNDLIARGEIEVLAASAFELAAVVQWIGSGALSGAELETLALMLAGKGSLCTTDAVLRRAAERLGIGDRLDECEGARWPDCPIDGSTVGS